MDENREARQSNKSGNSIPGSSKSENPIPTSSSSNSSPPRHKEFFPRVPNCQPSSSGNSRNNTQNQSNGNSRNNIQINSIGNSRNNTQNNSSGNSRNNTQTGGFLPTSMLPHNLLRNSVENNSTASTTESVEQVRQVQQQTRFGFLLPAQQLTSESDEEERRRERRERRERMNDRWNNAANRAGFNRDDETTSINAITQMLLAMERFEQEGHGNYQELIMRETNLLFGGLHFHDEHSDMRMDIDNMSYEELLALEENIGYVSTALSKDDVAKCLKKITYHSSSSRSTDKCSICQEEFEEGEEVGKLKCRHQYHMICINQWLSHKNLCPVCKCSLN